MEERKEGGGETGRKVQAEGLRMEGRRNGGMKKRKRER